MTCYARTIGSQKICARCGLNWDIDDPEPPECRNVRSARDPDRVWYEEAAPITPEQWSES